MLRLNPHLRQNYSIFMRNFKQNQHKLSNNHVRFSNQNLLCKFEPPSKKSWIHPCFCHSFYLIYMGQPIWNPVALPIWVLTWVLYRLLPSKHAYMGPIWATHMGSATGFGIGPIWVSPYAGCPDGSHITVP